MKSYRKRHHSKKSSKGQQKHRKRHSTFKKNKSLALFCSNCVHHHTHGMAHCPCPCHHHHRHRFHMKYLMKGGCNCGNGGLQMGGDNTLNLAYTGHAPQTMPNPHLAYTGSKRGGRPNANAYPNVQSPGVTMNFPNPQIKGGSSSVSSGTTDTISSYQDSGKYPDGLVGSEWTPNVSSWPGVNSNGNHYPLNTYPVDPQTAMINTGSAPPFSVGGRHRKRGGGKKHSRKMCRGGSTSNLLGQDLINFGRQSTNGIGSTYNALNGYSAPVNPLPWKDQLVNSNNLNSLKYDLMRSKDLLK